MVGLDRHHFPSGFPVKVCCKTVTPPWTTVMVALVNVTSVIVAVQLSLGHPPSVPVGCAGGLVVTLKNTSPFLILSAEIVWVPVPVTCPGFCPGAALPPALVQITEGVPVADRVMRMSPLPSPARVPMAVSVTPVSTNWGDLGLKWTLA